MPFTFDTKLGRYRDADTGRLVSEARVRLAVDAVADAASEQMAAFSRRLVAGDISLADWQTRMLQLTKEAHLATGMAAAGGRAAMTPSAYGFLGSELRAQYAYLRNFGAAIEAERFPLDGRVVARAGMYGQHARVTYESVRRRDQANRGYRFERNMLHAKESCNQCRALAARGWVELGTLPPIGSRTCLSRCRCTISFRKDVASIDALEASA